jgi:MATE family multidrug resistance protein
MQFIDTWMLARLGTDEPTAAGNAGIFAFSLVSMGVGTLFVVNTLVSQAFGRRDYAACGRYLGQGVWFSIAFAVMMLPFIGLLPHMFRGFGHTPALVGLESTYLRIVLTNAVFKLLGTAFSQFLLATNRPGKVMIAAVGGVGVNAIAAYALIFGHLGFQRMGISGAAWGQNVGVIVEMLVCIVFALIGENRTVFNATDWRLRFEEMRSLITLGIPSGIQIVADVLAWSLFVTWVLAQFGTVAMAANTFMFRYMVVSFMPAFGFATAVTALVGRYIGMGRVDIAEKRANLGFVLTAAYMMICGLLFFAGRHRLIAVFSSDSEVQRVGATLLGFAAVYQFFDALYIVYNGALRGAGDTFVPAVATVVLCWGITVLGGYAVAKLLPQFGPGGPWTVATIYGVILGGFMYSRFRAGRWKRIHLEKDQVDGLGSIPQPM